MDGGFVFWNHVPDRIGDGVVTIFFQQKPVKLIFHYQMIFSGFRRFWNDIGMTFAVERKMTDIAEQIGIGGRVCSKFSDDGQFVSKKGIERMTVVVLA